MGESSVIISTGGREFTVGPDGDEVLLTWKDVVNPGSDALFSRGSAVALGVELIKEGRGVDVRPQILEGICTVLENVASSSLRPGSEAHAEYSKVISLLHQLGPSTQEEVEG